MKVLLAAVALAAAAMATPMAFAQTSRAPGELLDRIAGRWVLEGTLAGKQTTHDVVASSVLNGQYVQLHEVSRDLDVHGRPVYEALVYLTWEDSRGEYSCLWLDSTSNLGLSNGVSCRAKPSGDEIALTFKYPSGICSTRHWPTTGPQTNGNGKWMTKRRAIESHLRAW